MNQEPGTKSLEPGARLFSTGLRAPGLDFSMGSRARLFSMGSGLQGQKTQAPGGSGFHTPLYYIYIPIYYVMYTYINIFIFKFIEKMHKYIKDWSAEPGVRSPKNGRAPHP